MGTAMGVPFPLVSSYRPFCPTHTKQKESWLAALGGRQRIFKDLRYEAPKERWGFFHSGR